MEREIRTLFTPSKIGNVEIKNRIVMSPMMLNFGQINGNVTEKMSDYYEERAKGGAGLIITEISRVNDFHGAGSMGQLSVSHKDIIPSLAKLAEKIHKYGTKIFVQLHHPGRQNVELLINTVPISILMDKVFSNYKNLIWKVIPFSEKLMEQNLLPLYTVSASKTPPSYFSESKVRQLRKNEIKRLIRQFVAGAVRVKESGCDGVELHGTHGYLIQQFISPYTNKRTDEYGGSFENRMRFVTEIIKGIKSECGNDFPIIVRISADECYDKIGKAGQGYGLDTGIEIAKYLERQGIDALDVSCAGYDTFNYWLEPISFKCGWRAYMAKAIKDNVNIPVLAANLIRSAEQAEKQLEDNVQDFVCLGRPFIADAHWADKVQNGKDKEIKRCINCLYCFESMMEGAFKGEHAKCSVNPTLGKEKIWEKIEKDGNGKVVLVIGAGPAGMTCAEWLEKRNFDVTVIEKSDKTGGQLQLANKPPEKEKINWCIEDLEYACRKSGVKFLLNMTADAALIKKYNPYAVVVATGADAIVPKFVKVSENKNVYTTTQILSGEVHLESGTVAIIGSGLTGLETAELLTTTNNKVSIYEMADTIAPGVWFQHIDDLVPKLLGKDTRIFTKHKFIRIESDGITVMDLTKGIEKRVLAEHIVLSMGVSSNYELQKELKGLGIKYYVIGDAAKVGNISNATESAFNLACLV